MPAFHDPRFGASFVAAILARVASPVLTEVRFVLPAVVEHVEAVLERPAWDQVAEVLSRTAVRTVVFAFGQKLERDVKVAEAVQGILKRTTELWFQSLASKGVEVTLRTA